jgi:beta-lactamase regulating signal transducer with metallopeptidase domain
MTEQINSIAQLWWHWMWPMFWQVGVLVGVVWIIDLMIRRRVWPQVRYALWLLVLLKLVLPPGLSAPTSVTSGLRPLAEQALKETLSTGQPTVAVHAEESELVPASQTKTPIMEPSKPAATVEAASDLEVPAVPAIFRPSGPTLCRQAYAMFGWLAGVLVLTAWLMLRLRQLRRLHRREPHVTDIPQWFEHLLREVAGKLNLRRVPQVVLSPSVASPAVFGAFRPVLLMPAEDTRKLSRKELEYVLLHELAHIKRGDLKVHGFYMLLQIVYWFNPLLWLVRRHLQHLRELCCDATVAKVLREETLGYRETILETARRLLAKPVEPGMGLLGLFEDSTRLAVRLRWLEKKTWKYRPLRIAVVFAIVAVMSACVLPMAARKHKSDEVKPEQSEFSAIMANGVSVELLGVCEHPSAGKQWWRPDGSELEERPYDRIGGQVHPDAKQRAFEFAIELGNLPTDEISTKVEAEEADGGLASGGKWMATSFVKDLEACTIKVAVAAGPWVTVSKSHGKSSSSRGTAAGGVSFSKAYEAASGDETDLAVAITVTDDILDRPCRIVAVTNSGELVRAHRTSGNSAGKARQTTVYFKYPPSITGLPDWEYHFQTRPYEWVELRNVSLRPGVKTEVEVERGVAEQVTDGRSEVFDAESGSVIEAVGNKATLESGTIVELLGATRVPVRDQPSWKPDGSFLEPLFDRVDYEPSQDPNSDKFEYYALPVRLENTPVDELGLIKWRFDDAKGYPGSANAYLGRERLYEKGLIVGTVKFAKESKVDSTTLFLGIASGQWRTIAAGRHWGVYQNSGDSIIVGEPTSGGPGGVSGEPGVHIGVTYNITDRQFRVVAVDKEGNIHFSGAGSGGTDNLRFTTGSFHNLERDQLEEYRFEVRPYEWVEFKDVSLRPGTKTQVEVDSGWGRVEGRLFIGPKVGANEDVRISLLRVDENDNPVETGKELKAVTDSNGQFVFDKVPVGWASVGRLILISSVPLHGGSYSPSLTLTNRTQVEVKANQTVNIVLGGAGRPVIGRFAAPADYGQAMDFSDGIRALTTAWPKSDKSKYQSSEYKHFAFQIKQDGTFRIEDVPAGRYELYVSVDQQPLDGKQWKTIADFSDVIEVPAMIESRMDEPLDLGTLQLKLPGAEVDLATTVEAEVEQGGRLEFRIVPSVGSDQQSSLTEREFGRYCKDLAEAGLRGSRLNQTMMAIAEITSGMSGWPIGSIEAGHTC